MTLKQDRSSEAPPAGLGLPRGMVRTLSVMLYGRGPAASVAWLDIPAGKGVDPVAAVGACHDGFVEVGGEVREVQLKPSMKRSAGQTHSNPMMRCASSKRAGWSLASGQLSAATGLRVSSWLTTFARPKW